MTWLSQHWQTLAAATIVAVTLVTFLIRALRRKKSSGCGHNCGCNK
jgi:hypothetical protein